ncbi:MAG: hypothetical protein ACXABY_08645 [Candidatus Thorarchaeota archaeon]|jgi:hypothetical protein
MKILMINHHPDVLHYMWRAFTELGHDVYVASGEVTLGLGFQYTSTKDNKLEVVDQLFEPGDLFSDMADVKFFNGPNVQDFDLVWSMLPEIKQLEIRHKIPTWFDAQMQAYLRNPHFSYMPGIKTANHPDAKAINGFDFCPNWADKQPPLKEPKYITQLITELDKVPFTNELLELRDKGFPVKIHGGKRCPDGFIRDIEILPYTRLLVHGKNFGVNCYAICKALDTGIPVYTSIETRELIGFGDLPDDLFLFSEDLTIEEAYHTAELMDNEEIQETYRSIYTLDRTINAVEEVINK